MNPLGAIVCTLILVVFFSACVAWIIEVFASEDHDE